MSGFFVKILPSSSVFIVECSKNRVSSDYQREPEAEKYVRADNHKLHCFAKSASFEDA